MPIQSVSSKRSNRKARSDNAATQVQSKSRQAEPQKKGQQVNRNKGSVTAQVSQAQAKKTAAHNPSTPPSGQQAAYAAPGALVLSAPPKGRIYGQSVPGFPTNSVVCNQFTMNTWSTGSGGGLLAGNVQCSKKTEFPSSTRFAEALSGNQLLDGQIYQYSSTNANNLNMTGAFTVRNGKVTSIQPSTASSPEKVQFQFPYVKRIPSQ
jgi:hypothetical protein